MLAQKLLGAMAGGSETLYVDDVFQTVVRTGTGATATITTGFQPDLVWIKGRSGTNSVGPHRILDSARASFMDALDSSSTAAELTGALSSGTAPTSTGYTLAGSGAYYNASNTTYVDWVFAKKAKFFDCGTFTTDSTTNTNQRIAHLLGQQPGLIIVKATGIASAWVVWHRSMSSATDSYARLDTTGAATTSAGAWGSSGPTASDFGVSTSFFGTSTSFVYYAFAHDTSAEGIIQCGSFTTDASGNTSADVNLGWEPQYLMLKRTSGVGSWEVWDNMRGMSMTSTARLYPNTSAAEDSYDMCDLLATGFRANGSLAGSSTYIYLAIRRPNKPPTSGTQVYNAIARTGTGAAATVTGVGFAPDLVMASRRDSNFPTVYDRLRGKGVRLITLATSAEGTESDTITSFNMDGVSLGTDATSGFVNTNTFQFINHFFKRAPGVFDVVCWTGTGSARTVAHNLGVQPELMIYKRRDFSAGWAVGVVNTASGYPGNYYIGVTLELNSGSQNLGYEIAWFNNGPVTSSVTTVGANTTVNASGGSFIGYLFATKAGISKVGSYTGNGSSQTIDCGFTTGARFFLVKATSTTGSWWIFDSVRGVISAADPALQLNSTAAEVTSADAVDPTSVGIAVNQEATCSINANGVSYVYLALA